jgi:DNA-binding MarR family transcriptional regulator
MVELPRTPVGTLTVRLGVLGVSQEARYAGRLAALGLRPKHVILLSALRMGGAESQQELAAALGIAPSLVVLLADQLAALNAIKRVRDPADRRRQRLHLTTEGDRLLDEATAVAVALDDECTAILPAEDRVALTRILEQLAAADALRSYG